MSALKTTSSISSCTLDDFAAHHSVSVGVVRAWVKSGYVPSVKIGRYRFINLVKYHQYLNEREFVTLVNYDDASEMNEELERSQLNERD